MKSQRPQVKQPRNMFEQRLRASVPTQVVTKCGNLSRAIGAGEGRSLDIMTFGETLAVNVLSLVAGGLLGYGFAELQQFYGKRKEKREAAALIRLESEMNILWLDDVLKSKLWFRDEAFVEMKKRGYISYLPRPLPYLIAQAYDTLYRVNYLTERARDGEPAPELEREVEVLRKRLEAINTVIDQHFESISKNYGPPSSS